MTLAAHPATALFPMMDEPALSELASDIDKHGLQHPVVLYEGAVLDGRNRVAACERIGRPADFVQWQPENGITPIEWVIATNLHRRHLSTSQRAAIAAEALPMLEAEAKTRVGGDRRSSTSFEDDDRPARGRSVNRAAAMVNVGHASVERAKQVRQVAPELFDQVKAGKITVTAALREAGLPDSQPKNAGATSRRKRLLPVPKRYPPAWRRHFTSWCRGVLPEDKPYLLAMSAELHTALANLGLTCTEGEE